MNVLTRALSVCALVCVAVGVTAGTAFADPICSPAVPILGQEVSCTYNAGGNTTVLLPAGTATITVVLNGAGGGAGGSMMGQAGGAGGRGARVTTVVNASGLTALTLVIGRGGQQGSDVIVPGGIAGGGGGGGFSALYPGRLTEPSSVMAVAGGGGGGQGGSPAYVGGDGAAQSTAAGGAGLGTSGCGGGGGADGTGGSGFTNGLSWTLGGAGGSDGDFDAGNGGAGYGGGAEGGGACFAGGGAGGSFVDPRVAIGAVTYEPLGAIGGSDGFVSLTFNAQTYTVAYDANGGADRVTGTPPVDITSPYVSGSSVTVLGNTGALTRDGYIFNGWNTARDGSGTPYAPTNTFTIGANTTLYALWIPAALTLTSTRVRGHKAIIAFIAPAKGTTTTRGTAVQTSRAGVIVCSGTTKVRKAGKAVVKCTLNANGRRLRAKGALTVTLTTTFVTNTGTRLSGTSTAPFRRKK